MAINLVSLVTQFLTPEMIGRIASALGLDRTITQKAIAAAIPAILAALSKVAAQPSGAQKLADVTRQQSSAVDSFANMLGKGQSSFIDRGRSYSRCYWAAVTKMRLRRRSGKASAMHGP
jgi:hypothetical protein